MECTVGFCVRLVEFLSQVECDIQKVNNLFVAVDDRLDGEAVNCAASRSRNVE